MPPSPINWFMVIIGILYLCASASEIAQGRWPTSLLMMFYAAANFALLYV